ncbi:MAG: hypothetical protein QG594_955 [Bacteroidota bacterium]|nr:hypothetical protein [Bacteroidota bacterium]
MLNLKYREPGTIQLPDNTDKSLYLDDDTELLALKSVGEEGEQIVEYIQTTNTPQERDFKALLTQVGTADPTMIILKMPTGLSPAPTIERIGIGEYRIIVNGFVSLNKHLAFIGGEYGTYVADSDVQIKLERENDSYLKIYTKRWDGSKFALVDDVLNHTPIWLNSFYD